MGYTSLLRRKEHEELSKIDFSGSVLDLGGSKKSDYFKIISKQASRITVVNGDKEADPDIVADIENKLNFPDGSFDSVVAMNLIEHIFNYDEVLGESFRVLKKGGRFVITVPFLFTIHPSPEDYFRYTKSSLIKMFFIAGFSDIVVKELGSGVMIARYQLIQNFLPGFLRLVFEKLAFLEDKVILFLAGTIGKKYKPEYFPLGYIVIAHKK